jgi:hypothetical protein
MIHASRELARVMKEGCQGRQDGIEAFFEGKFVGEERGVDCVLPEKAPRVPRCPPCVFLLGRLDRFPGLLDEAGMEIGN